MVCDGSLLCHSPLVNAETWGTTDRLETFLVTLWMPNRWSGSTGPRCLASFTEVLADGGRGPFLGGTPVLAPFLSCRHPRSLWL